MKDPKHCPPVWSFIPKIKSKPYLREMVLTLASSTLAVMTRSRQHERLVTAESFSPWIIPEEIRPGRTDGNNNDAPSDIEGGSESSSAPSNPSDSSSDSWSFVQEFGPSPLGRTLSSAQMAQESRSPSSQKPSQYDGSPGERSSEDSLPLSLKIRRGYEPHELDKANSVRDSSACLRCQMIDKAVSTSLLQCNAFTLTIDTHVE